MQDIARGTAHADAALMLVIDGSARLADTTDRLVAALDAIPAGIKVGAIVASEPTQQRRRWRPGPTRRSARW